MPAKMFGAINSVAMVRPTRVTNISQKTEL